MKDNVIFHDFITFGRQISKVLSSTLGILLLILGGTATGGEVRIKKIGDRVPLYESASVYYLRLAADLPKDERDRVPDLDEWATGIQHQAAMYAFMFFIDRTRAQTSRDDTYYRSLIKVTGTLMERLDWAEFEEYVGNMGFAYIGGFFDGYKKEMITEDLRNFKECVRVLIKDQNRGTHKEGTNGASPSNNSGTAPRQPREGQPPAKPGSAPK